MRVWRYDPSTDAPPDLAETGDLDDRSAVLVAAPEGEQIARAWMAVDAYDDTEAALLFAAPSGSDYTSYVAALLAASVNEARRLGFRSVLAHWRGGWATAATLLPDHGFAEDAAGIWRRSL